MKPDIPSWATHIGHHPFSRDIYWGPEKWVHCCLNKVIPTACPIEVWVDHGWSFEEIPPENLENI